MQIFACAVLVIEIGLVDEKCWQEFQKKTACMESTIEKLHATRIKPLPEVNEFLTRHNSTSISQAMSFADLLRRPEITLSALIELDQLINQGIIFTEEAQSFQDEIGLQVKYEGYIKRQEEQIARFKKLERMKLPEDLVYKGLPGLSNEVVEKLTKVQPRSLGQASRISGVTPAALSVLQVHLKRLGHL